LDKQVQNNIFQDGGLTIAHVRIQVWLIIWTFVVIIFIGNMNFATSKYNF